MNATSLLGQLKLGHKFMILGLIAALLAIIPAFLYMSEAGKVLDAYESEHEGLPIVVDGLKVVQYTQQHRGLSALVLGGVSAVAEKRRAKQAEADAAYGRLEKAAAKLGDKAIIDAFAAAKQE
jgi:hypothetical protein